MVILRTYDSPVEAEIAKGMLDAHGIPSFVANENNLYVPVFNGVSLYVEEKDAPAALALLKEHGD